MEQPGRQSDVPLAQVVPLPVKKRVATPAEAIWPRGYEPMPVDAVKTHVLRYAGSATGRA